MPNNQSVHFIMMHPSHPGNIGAAARAIKTMGFKNLYLVNPREKDPTNHPDAIALASGAQDILQQAHLYPDLESASKQITLSFALTARPRHMGPSIVDIREAATIAKTHLNDHASHQVALILGTERTGLDNEAISHCHYICYIPANPEYSSLNVAQALQLAAWEFHYALIEASQFDTHSQQSKPPYASQQQLEDFYKHWEKALKSIEFIHPQQSKKLMYKMRYLFTKQQLTQEEIQMLRGVCTQILKKTKD